MTKALPISIALLGLAGCGGQEAERAIVATVATPIFTATPIPTDTPTPSVSLALQLERSAGAVRITAELTNLADHPLFYLAGCSALCRPWLYRAVSFHLTGPDGAEVIVKSSEYPYPCAEPLGCPAFEQQIPPGESVEEILDIDGTAWTQTLSSGYFCGVCTGALFEEGRYTLTARSSYSASAPGNVYIPAGQVETILEFDWP